MKLSNEALSRKTKFIAIALAFISVSHAHAAGSYWSTQKYSPSEERSRYGNYSNPRSPYAGREVPSTSNTSSYFAQKTQAKEQIFAPGSNQLALALGQVFLLGKLSDGIDDNIGWQLEYTHGVSELFGFNMLFGNSAHSNRLTLTHLTSALRINARWFDRVVPHLDLGLGFYRVDWQKSQNIRLTSILYGLHVGPGVDLQITGNVFFGTDLKIHNTFNALETDKFGNYHRVGGVYTSFLVHAGAMF